MKLVASRAGAKAYPLPSPSTARVVDGKLVLSCPGAAVPVVWQMDLSQARASALEVREGVKGDFILALKTIKGESADIAVFPDKAQGVEALMAAARALENAQGQIRPVASLGADAKDPSSTASPAKKKGGKWVTALLGLVLIVVLIAIWGSLAPQPISGAAAPVASSAAGGEAGVPMSADAFLMNRPR